MSWNVWIATGRVAVFQVTHASKCLMLSPSLSLSTSFVGAARLNELEI